mgnify:CR=1 FL=1
MINRFKNTGIFIEKMERAPNLFAAGSLDRAIETTQFLKSIEKQIASEESRIIPIWRSQMPVRMNDAPTPTVLTGSAIASQLETASQIVFLGIQDGAPVFAADFSEAMTLDDIVELEDESRLLDLRTCGALLNREDASLAAFACGMLYWHQRHLFCGVCGAETKSEDAGRLRQCSNRECNAEHFPRTDPAIIVLVTKGKKCLLGRAARWPEKVYSTLAGFVEPGESLEDAVRREIFEESGVRLKNVSYHSSQPWPFPSSLMIGFYAEAESDFIKVNKAELEDARWFDKKEILQRSENKLLKLPSKISISRRLILDLSLIHI